MAQATRPESLKALLHSWFQAGLTRGDHGFFDSSSCDVDTARLAARIYKRGLAGLREKNAPEPMTTAPDSTAAGESLPPALVPPLSLMPRPRLRATLDDLSARRFLILDSHFASLWPEWNARLASAGAGMGVGAGVFAFDANEKNKSLETVFSILDALAAHTVPVTSILAVGGGITLDVAGFVAGLSGRPVDYVATTLLSAVDASVGGKTGVNFAPFGKNQLGLFVPARSLTIVPEYFLSLRSLDIAAGLAEAAKHSWLYGTFADDSALFERVLHAGSAAASEDFAALALRNFEAKAQVVLRDPREAGVRKLLNLGHTLGHLFEGLADEGFLAPLPHGLAVCAGMLTLLRAGLLEGAPAGFEPFLASLLHVQGIGFPLRLRAPGWEPAAQRLLRSDKKNASAARPGAEFVLPRYAALSGASPVTSPGTGHSTFLPWEEIRTLLLPISLATA